MGNAINSSKRSLKAWCHSRKTGNTKLKRKTACPVCGAEFNGWRTYNEFNYHVDFCLLRQPKVPELEPANCVKDQSLEEKLIWIQKSLEAMKVPWTEDCIRLVLSREELMEDSLERLLLLDEEDMHKEFQIGFTGETAQDAGGLMREWLNLLVLELTAPENAFFQTTNTEKVSYMITQKPKEEFPRIYYLFGRIIAKAAFDGVALYCPLAPVMYKYLLDLPVALEDIHHLDTDLYNSLLFMQENSVEGVFFESFVVEKTYKNQKFTKQLVRGGSSIPVTDQNKHKYISLRTKFEAKSSVKKALKQFKKGFTSVIPYDVISVLSEPELELFLCGCPFIDIGDWQEFTQYKGRFSKNHPVIQWFWQVLENYSQKKLSLLLKFVTGTSRVPVQGFKELKTLRGEPALFTVESLDSEGLPKAHTCFNRLDLPLYQTKSQLKKALNYVIQHHSLGFGLKEVNN